VKRSLDRRKKMTVKKTSMKLWASSASLFLLMACAQNSGSSAPSACVQSQGISTAFEQVSAQAQLQGENIPLKLIVKLTDLDATYESLRASLQAVMSENGLKIKKIGSGQIAIQIPANSPARAIIQKFIDDKKILALEEDRPTFLLPTSESSNSAMATATAIAGKEQSTERAAAASDKEILVAIIDSGVDYTHSELAPYMWHNPGEIADNGVDDDHNGFVDDVYGWDFVNEDNKPMADDTRSYHGTHVAGIVKQAALLAESGIKLKIMALKYLDSSATGQTSDAIRAIDYAIKNGAIVMNNSWGSFGYSTALSEAIERSRAAHVLFVAAAGNGDSNGNGVNLDQTPFYPAAYTHDNIISVAAADDSGVLAGWSNFGAQSVDLGAPGVSILSYRNGERTARLSGTSMASPYVAGIAAALWSERPDLSYTEVRKVLLSTTTDKSSLEGKVASNGEINWSAAEQMAAEYPHDPADTGSPNTPDSSPSPGIVANQCDVPK
jgi:subtilisin family serine protease